MSYILDALRRADAERTRGAVPGLHAQNIPADDEPAARNFGPLIWAAGGAGALLVAVVVILVVAPWRTAPSGQPPLAPAPELNPAAGTDPSATTMARGATPGAHPGAIDPAALPVEPPISRAAANADAPPLAPASAPAYPPPATTQRLADRAAAGRVAPLEPRNPAARNAATTPASSDRAAPNNGSPYAVANANAAAANTPAEHYGPATAAPAPNAKPARAAAVPNINDLPPATRSGLPHLAVGGAIYSESPSERMVILNGQVFHEGDKPAADTVLEQIRLKSAILNWRGQRYEITY